MIVKLNLPVIKGVPKHRLGTRREENLSGERSITFFNGIFYNINVFFDE